MLMLKWNDNISAYVEGRFYLSVSVTAVALWLLGACSDILEKVRAKLYGLLLCLNGDLSVTQETFQSWPVDLLAY